MTMFSSEKRWFCCGYGGGYVEGLGVMNRLQGYDYCNSEGCIGSDLAVGSLMAEDESRIIKSRLSEVVESSSKDAKEEGDEGWLQLSIGSHSHEIKQDLRIDQSPQRVGPAGQIELELMPSNSGNNNNNINNSRSNSHSQSQIRPLVPMPEFRAPRAPVMNYESAAGFSFLQNTGNTSSSSFPQHQEINWAFRPITINTATASSYSNLSPSNSSPMPSSSYISRPFQLYAGGGVDIAPRPALDFRVIQPPNRPNSGIWFMLQASQNQEKEPFLPQISKSYLRIKDGRMTVGLLVKYLINKLRLENESEIEVTCKGQRLLPFLTLQHVRDNIWNPRDFVTLLPNSSTTDHIMVLHYARIASN